MRGFSWHVSFLPGLFVKSLSACYVSQPPCNSRQHGKEKIMREDLGKRCTVNHEEVQMALKKLATMPNCKELAMILAYIVQKLDE